MNYIKISNRSDNVNRLYLEKLGVSTKRDSSDTIGQFGSGSKFAPIAALRNGWEWINVGTDETGDYRMEYVVVEEGGLNCICFMYDDNIKESSYTIDAGVLSWEDPFQIFREAFSNALDAHTEFGAEYKIEVVDEVKFEEGWFSVYLTAAPELLAIVNNLEKYFILERKAIASVRCSYDDDMRLYPTIDTESNFYYKRVLVNTGFGAHDPDKLPSMFDYECDKITLNEERRVRNVSDISAKFTTVCSNLRADDESHREVAKTFIDNMTNDRVEWLTYEYHLYSNFTEENSAIYKAFHHVYGEDAVILAPNEKVFEASMKVHSKRPVTIGNPFMLKLLQECGVKGVKEILGDDAEYDFVDTLSARNQEAFDRAYEIVHQFDERIETFPIRFFAPRENQNEILGVAAQNSRNIYLSTRILDSMASTVGTIVHELDHFISGWRDEDYREFRNVADKRIAKLLIENAMINEAYNKLAQKDSV